MHASLLLSPDDSEDAFLFFYNKLLRSLLHIGTKITTDTNPEITAHVNGISALNTTSTCSLAITIDIHFTDCRLRTMNTERDAFATTSGPMRLTTCLPSHPTTDFIFCSIGCLPIISPELSMEISVSTFFVSSISRASLLPYSSRIFWRWPGKVHTGISPSPVLPTPLPRPCRLAPG